MVIKFGKSVWRAVVQWVWCRMWPAPEQVDALIDGLLQRVHEWCALAQQEAAPRTRALAEQAVAFLLTLLRQQAQLPPIIGPLVRKFVERYLEHLTGPMAQDLALAAEQGAERLCQAIEDVLEEVREKAKAAYCPTAR